ncbi:MAG: M48 family metalloprotease [Alphaproteobacteria bacterium]|nr:M48 family metalloprotease [Alphaproteobacteria bacterium]
MQDGSADSGILSLQDAGRADGGVVSQKGIRRTFWGKEDVYSLKSTRSEKIAISACFAAAAAFVCASIVVSPQPSIPFYSSLIGASFYFVASDRIGESLYTASSPFTREKFGRLQRDALAYSDALGLKEAPQLFLLYKKGPPQTVKFSRSREGVAFHEDHFFEQPDERLRAILAHETAHIAQKHRFQKIEMITLMLAAVEISGMQLYTLAPMLAFVPLFALHSRICEYQADRIGAVVSNERLALVEFLEAAMKARNKLPASEIYQAWSGLPVAQKCSVLGTGLVRAPRKGLRYIFRAMHPHEECRIERLKRLQDPPRRYESESAKAWFSRLVLRP